MPSKTAWKRCLAPAPERLLLLVLLGGLFFFALSSQRPAHAGGPLIVGGIFGVDAQPFTWDTSAPIDYTTDGGMLGTLSETEANDRVATMFQVWQDVTTATISFSRAGPIMNAGVFTDGDVDTMEEFDAVEGACLAGNQSPIVYDADGSLFDDLVGDPNVIGFAGPCQITPLGRIVGAIAALNGRFLDGIDDSSLTPPNLELTDAEFNTAFIHEFGHFFGLDHSQINVNCLGGCGVDDLEGLPTMFPKLLSDEMQTLAPDDIAWISRLYPGSTFATTFGTIEGTIFFSDGQTPAQGVNVIARQVEDGNPANGDESRRNAVSVVSGYLFTGNPGQSVTGTNPGSSFGSRTPTLIGFYRIPGLLPGNYTIEVESINEGFDAGSGVGPLNPPIPMPGTAPPPAGPVAVIAGPPAVTVDITLVNTPPRFDQFEN